MDAITDTIRQIRNVIDNSFPSKKLTAAVFKTEKNYINPSKEYIPSWFVDWNASHPNNQYFTANSPNYYIPVFMKFQQDPVYWIQSGLVDVIFSMTYTSNDTYWQSELFQYQSFLGNYYSLHFGMGLGWYQYYDESDQSWHGPGFDPDHIIRKISWGRTQGLKAFSIFELGNSKDADKDWMLIQKLNCSECPFEFQIESFL
jgi:hypothetical protein